MIKRNSVILCVTIFATTIANGATQFAGGMCVSQGTWIQAALQQSDIVNQAINTLRNDPACQVMIDALDKAPKIDKSSGVVEEGSSFANVYRELSAFSEALQPIAKLDPVKKISAQNSAAFMQNNAFRNIVFDMVFNKSLQAVQSVNAQEEFSILSNQDQEKAKAVSLRLKSFLNRSGQLAEVTMQASKGILAALPESEMCFHKRPSQLAAIFGAVAHSAAALTTGGQVNGVGELIAAVLRYQREMSYINALLPLEKEKFNTAVSCLLESTAESYCATQDAEDSLNYLDNINLSDLQIENSKAQKEIKQLFDEAVANRTQDTIANPLGGLIILMRDIPVLQGWMQKVLFGIDPKLKIEADMKNNNWAAYLNFVQSVNSLQADFRDSAQMYYVNKNQDKIQKLATIRTMIEDTIGNFNKAGQFFSKVFPSSQAIRFALISVPVPKELNVTNDFESFWNRWVNDGSNGFNNPDLLLETIRQNLLTSIEKAQRQANTFFAARMIVDPQNLLAEAMKGPGISPYQALVNIRTYHINLQKKLTMAVQKMSDDPAMEIRKDQIESQIPLLQDSVAQINRMIEALKSTSKISTTATDSTKIQSQNAMDVIYEAANMMISRDSFFGVRMATAIQADISDTLWRKQNLTEDQYTLFMSIGPEIVNRLAGFFTTNPTFQRADISQAKVIHVANLAATESMFWSVIFNQIVDINCKLEGGIYCAYPDVADNYMKLNEFNQRLTRINAAKAESSETDSFLTKLDRLAYKSYLSIGRWYDMSHKPTEDADAFKQVRAKLCIQSLAFESRETFREICRGVNLKSDFANAEDTFGLNMDFDSQLKRVAELKKSGKPSSDQLRNIGVCALRSYLRKNHIFYMYREYMKEK